MVAAQALAGRPVRSPVRLLDPPFCYGAWRGPRVDVPVLATRVRWEREGGAAAVVLTDIPDDEESLMAALALDGVVGALALGCGSLDVWVEEGVATSVAEAGLAVRRGMGALPRVEVRAVDELKALWGVLEASVDQGRAPGQ